jgi:hypothetical protein
MLYPYTKWLIKESKLRHDNQRIYRQLIHIATNGFFYILEEVNYEHSKIPLSFNSHFIVCLEKILMDITIYQ